MIKIWPFFKTKKTELVEKSQPAIRSVLLDDPTFFGTPETWSPVFPRQAQKYYDQASPVFTSIDLISKEFKSITPRVWDTKKKDFVDHPVLDLLKAPNPFNSKESFFEKYATDFLVTGNAFIEATGDVKKPPLEIFTIDAETVQIQRSTNDDFPSQYNVNQESVTQNFMRTLIFQVFGISDVDRFGSIRFYDQFLKRELWHIKRISRRGSLFGMSLLTSLFYDIEQFLNSQIYNWSLLKRGGKLTGQYTAPNGISDDYMQKLKAQINNTSGPESTGTRIILENGLEYKEIGNNNVDMDFLNLKTNVTHAIFNVYNIPLAFVTAEQMTLGNLEAAKIILYDNAVLPLTQFLFSELTRFLMPRYENSEDLEITFDIGDIPALRPRTIEGIERLSKTNILTVNELRAQLGKEALVDGDQILAPANLLPIATDTVIEDNPKLPRPRSNRKELVEILSKQTNADGTPAYSKTEINDICQKNGYE